MSWRDQQPLRDVLICHSEAQEAEGLAPFLCRDGYRVDSVADPMQAMERLTTKTFDSIIVMVQARDRKWIDSIPVFNQLFPDLPVVVIADTNCLETQRLVRRGKVFYFLLKPLDMAEVKAVLRDACAKASA